MHEERNIFFVAIAVWVIVNAFIFFPAIAQVFDSLPDPGSNRCRIMENTETGERVMSDGKKWYRIEEM